MVVEAAAAACVFLAVSAVVLAFARGRTLNSNEVERRLRSLYQPEVVGMEGRGLLMRNSGTFPFLRALVSKDGSWARRATVDLQQAGLSLKVSEYVLLRVFVAVMAVLAVVLLVGGTAGLVGGLIGGLLGFWVPALYVQQKKSRRINAISRQLVEALTLISNALRSGFAFTQAVELAAKQLSPPLQTELNSFLRESALGARSEDALRALVERSGSVDVEMVVTSILIQRTTGGNLSEVLDNVAETIRERDRLRGEIRALTAQQRLTGQVLSVYPVALALVFFLIAPSLMALLWETEAGIILLGIAITLQVTGVITIRRILSIDI